MYTYIKTNGEKIESERHFLSARELCMMLGVRRKTGYFPIKLMRLFLEEYLNLERYYYIIIEALNRKVMVYDFFPERNNFSANWNLFLQERKNRGIDDELK